MHSRQVGGFLLEAELGRGGMSVVHRARAADGRPVALKLLLQADAAGLASFARERRLQAQLGAEAGFVPLLDAGVERGQPWLVMPLLEGGSLRDRLRRGPLPRPEALALVIGLARAMARAHGLGIVHRDLKPENVLFDAAGRAFVADLGLAKHCLRGTPGASQSVGLTRTGVGMGTPGYMAPEQLDDARAVGPAADVFALGAILFECLSGAPPFPARSLLGLMEALERGPPSLAAQGVQAPPGLEALLARCLSRTPEARYPHAGALAAALEAEAAERPPVRSAASPRAAWLALALLLLGAGGAAAIALRPRAPHPPRTETSPLAPPPSLPAVVPDPAPPSTEPGWTRPAADPRSGARLSLLEEWTALPRHGSVVFFTAVRADGRLALTAGADGCVLVWDLAKPAVAARPVLLPGERRPATGLLWDPGDPRLAWVGSTDGHVRLLDVVEGRWLRELALRPNESAVGEHPWGLAVGPEGELLAAMNSGDLVTWRPLGGQEQVAHFQAHEGPVYTVGVTPEGRIWTCGEDGAYREWTAPGRLHQAWSLSSPTLTSAVHLPDGQVAVSAGQGLFMLDRAAGTSHLVPGHRGRVNFLALDRPGERLYSAGFNDGVLGVLKRGALKVSRVRGYDELLNVLAVTPDGKTVVLGTMDGTVEALDLAGPRRRPGRTAHGGAVTALAQQGELVLSAGGDGALQWWDRQGKLLASAVGRHAQGNGSGYPRFPGWVRAVLLPGGEALGVGEDGHSRRVRVQGLTAEVLADRPETSSAVAASGAGALASLSDDGREAVRVTPSGQRVAFPSPPGTRWSALAWALEGTLLLGDDGGGIYRADAGGQLVAEPLPGLPGAAITCLAPAQEGIVAGTATGNLLHLRRGLATPQPVPCGRGPVRAVAVDPGGRFLATLDPQVAGQASSVTVWAEQGTETVVHDRLELPPGGDELTCLLWVAPRELLVGTRAGRLLRYRVAE